MAGPRTAVILTHAEMQRYEAKAIQSMLAETDIEIPLVVVRETSEKSSEETADDRLLTLRNLRLFVNGVASTPRETLGETWNLVKHRVFGVRTVDEEYLASVAVDDVPELRDSRRLTCRPVEDGAWNELPAEVVDEIAATGDIAIHTQPGFGLLRGDVLSAVEHGVIGFHLTDIREHRGAFPGYWEIVEGDDRTGATLQRFNESIDGGEVLRIETVPIAKTDTALDVRVKQARTAVPMLADAIQGLRAGETPTELDALGPLHYERDIWKPRNWARFHGRNAIRRLRRRIADDGERKA